jgi:hypothetical protein
VAQTCHFLLWIRRTILIKFIIEWETGCTLKMQINNNRKNTNNNHIPNLEEQRDIELENIIGNLMIAQYQVDKLRSRLSERIGGYGSTSNKKTSTNIFKHNDKWYKISMRVDEMSVDHPDISSQLKE